MASRRTRIKGIANIPQRRQVNATIEEHTQSQVNTEEKSSSNNENSNLTFGVDVKVDDKEHPDIPNVEIRNKPVLVRRKFIKPTVSVSVINRIPKNLEREPVVRSDADDVKKNSKDLEKSDKIIVLNKIIIPAKNTSELAKEVRSCESVIATNVSNTGGEVTLDEVHLTSQDGLIVQKPELPLDNHVKKLIPYINTAPNSDTEYPPPPPSPSKINRSRIKAIPRLSNRKTSFSASESEDESRRNFNRNRNDSVCSTASGIPESITECMSPQRPNKEFNSIIQKKCSRTEQSRKLAEARREFQRRFGTNKPDRQRLTMIDLIFYNPTSNPMTNDKKSNEDKVDDPTETVDTPIEIESEKVDDPQVEDDDAAKSDEENEMPVPQIKIGPSGEIILDEKSLVIESKEVAKQREELQKTQLVNGDFDTGYGVFKRQRRAKDWTQSETLRFYKALNTIGTDFTLMWELFPRRSRRELKMKFKKEERINKTLIDRAIMQPCSFDYEELKHEVDMEEKELEELQRQKEAEIKLRQEKNEAKLAKKRKASQEENMENSKGPQPRPPKLQKRKKPKMKKLSIENVLEDSDADESDIATQSESDDEVLMPLRPTRSGRVPKLTKKFDTTEIDSVESIINRNKMSQDSKTNNVEPGSIMIITEKGTNGEPVYKIFMVTPDQNATPLQLTSDVVSKAIAFKKGISAQNIMTISANVTDDEGEDTAVVEENNVTIPADENVTTLREGNNETESDTNDVERLENSVIKVTDKVLNEECLIINNN